MIVIRRKDYTTKIYKDGRVKTTYHRTKKSSILNAVMLVAAIAVTVFTLYQFAQGILILGR